MVGLVALGLTAPLPVGFAPALLPCAALAAVLVAVEVLAVARCAVETGCAAVVEVAISVVDASGVSVASALLVEDGLLQPTSHNETGKRVRYLFICKKKNGCVMSPGRVIEAEAGIVFLCSELSA